MITIAVGDIVTVQLHPNFVLQGYIVKSVPGNNEVYWELEDPDTGFRVVVGPSLLAMRKTS